MLLRSGGAPKHGAARKKRHQQKTIVVMIIADHNLLIATIWLGESKPDAGNLEIHHGSRAVQKPLDMGTRHPSVPWKYPDKTSNLDAHLLALGVFRFQVTCERSNMISELETRFVSHGSAAKASCQTRNVRLSILASSSPCQKSEWCASVWDV